MILTLCTDNPGGMRSVVAGYQRDGLFDAFDGRLIVTHRSGSVLSRLAIAVRAFVVMLGLLLTHRVNIIHAHAAMRGSFWRKNFFLAAARWFGVKTILHLHGSEFKEFVSSLSPRKRERVRACLRAADLVLVLSKSWADYIAELEPSARVQVMPNYVLLPDIRLEKPAGNTVRFLFLGILGARKGIYDLLDALVLAKAAIPNLHLVVGGNGEVEQVRQRVQSLGLQNEVSVLGWIGPDEKAAELERADFYVLPSHNEGLPVSLLEAMSYGLPVVSTDVGGIPELVRERQDGLLVKPGQVDSIAAALIALAESPALRAEMGRNARKRIEESYSREVVMPQLVSVYKRFA